MRDEGRLGFRQICKNGKNAEDLLVSPSARRGSMPTFVVVVGGGTSEGSPTLACAKLALAVALACRWFYSATIGACPRRALIHRLMDEARGPSRPVPGLPRSSA
jgi:hypothetical protein